MIVCVLGGATVAQHDCPNTVDKMDGDPTDAFTGLSKFA